MAEKKTNTAEAPEELTLQQKFIKLREAVPAIIKKQHSDGVKYKFARINDIYELLTPAMNAHGVNFDIVGEEATRHSENGDALYYHSYQQSTRNGVRTVWVYEADLTIRWTNADRPVDTLEVVLHAIGTNDGGPDKAKGSAWTYCLKYYFFEKFGIDQGEDDPDMSDNSGNTIPDAQNAGYNKQNYQNNKNTYQTQQNAQSGKNSPQKALSDAQLARMYKKGEDVGITQEQINDRIMQKYGIKEPRNLNRDQYDETCNSLDALKQTQGGQENV